MKERILPRITDKEIRLLESLDSEHRKEILCNTLNFVIKEEEKAIPIFEDLKKGLGTYWFKYDLNDIIDPIISHKNRDMGELKKLANKMGCNNEVK